MAGRGKNPVEPHLLGFNDQEEGSFITIKLKEGPPIQKRGWPWIEISLRQILKEKADSVSLIRDDNLLIKTKNSYQTKLLLKSEKLGDTPATSALHPKLNFTKGSIYAPNLTMLTTQEILEWMTPLGVTNVTRPKNSPNTPILFLTFSKLSCPAELKFDYVKYQVRPWYPTPAICSKCGLIGHLKIQCREEEVCLNCCSPPHEHNQCDTKCRNCGQNHHTTSKECPQYLNEADILKTAYKNKIPYGKAKAMIEQSKTDSRTFKQQTTKTSQNDPHLQQHIKNLETKIDTMADTISQLSTILASVVTAKQIATNSLPQQTINEENKKTTPTAEKMSQKQPSSETDLIEISNEPDTLQTPAKKSYIPDTVASYSQYALTPDHQYAATDKTELTLKSKKKEKTKKNTKTK